MLLLRAGERGRSPVRRREELIARRERKAFTVKERDLKCSLALQKGKRDD